MSYENVQSCEDGLFTIKWHADPEMFDPGWGRRFIKKWFFYKAPTPDGVELIVTNNIGE